MIIGSMITIPFIFVSLVTLPYGVRRFKEYWRFYELHYGISMTGIAIFLIPLALLGFIGLFHVIYTIYALS
ncbi:hypothetical protein GCM10007086_02340 [Photobacterium aphoticum]|nr:hypothetical protein GCM10007086_02340 [Photobacterium aphoticum]